METNGKRKRKVKSPPQPPPQLTDEQLAQFPPPSRARKTKTIPTEPEIPSLPSDDTRFIGPIVDPDVAKSRWPHRYHSNKKEDAVLITLSDGSTEEKVMTQARYHYSKALIDDREFDLCDDALFESPADVVELFIGNMEEMFETWGGEVFVCARWYYRSTDTVMKAAGETLIPENRVFYSDVRDDNPLGCVNRKVRIAKVGVNMSAAQKETLINSSDFYYDMTYSFPHAFKSVYTDLDSEAHAMSQIKLNHERDLLQSKPATILDLYAGCGAMSSGLTIGALLGGKDVLTKWAVDFNSDACDSFRNNHPNTEVYHYDANDFFKLVKEWYEICSEYNSETDAEDCIVVDSSEADIVSSEPKDEDVVVDDGEVVDAEGGDAEYEVDELLEIHYGHPEKKKKEGVYFKVHWKGYSSKFDTWEPLTELRGNCTEKIKEFVRAGIKNKLLPLPGEVDIVCGGPPCQGISGFNRFRKSGDPMERDEKNGQLIVYMNTIQFLKPRYVLMENVTDILKFSGGDMAHYAVARLVSMNFQARIGIMAAGAYGVPQCRMRFFLWGAGQKECLPCFPLPTHKIMKKGVVINEYKECVVGHMEEHNELLDTVLLGDAISDLPKITNSTSVDEMEYGSSDHSTSFQKSIRLKKLDIFGYAENGSRECLLYDHRPYKCNEYDYKRVCRIPKKKGANFRDLPGLIIDENNKVRIDPSVEREYLGPKKPLVPDYAISFEGGKSIKPFGRLWMDEVVGTVVGRPEPHNQIILHWSQDRVLSVRENARLQGFPDCYKLSGPIKARYIQVGNAVSFSASVPLGYCLATAMQGNSSAKPLSLPFKFPGCFEELRSLRNKSTKT